MELKYSLDDNDFLVYQLYTASKSKNIKNQRRRTFLILVAVFVVMFYSIYSTQETPSYYVLIFFLLLIVYRLYDSSRYKNHYKKFINDNYKERFGLMCTLNFAENQIIEYSKIGESKINYDSLAEINEIQDYYFLKLITSQASLFPKKKLEILKVLN